MAKGKNKGQHYRRKKYDDISKQNTMLLGHEPQYQMTDSDYDLSEEMEMKLTKTQRKMLKNLKSRRKVPELPDTFKENQDIQSEKLFAMQVDCAYSLDQPDNENLDKTVKQMSGFKKKMFHDLEKISLYGFEYHEKQQLIDFMTQKMSELENCDGLQHDEDLLPALQHWQPLNDESIEEEDNHDVDFDLCEEVAKQVVQINSTSTLDQFHMAESVDSSVNGTQKATMQGPEQLNETVQDLLNSTQPSPTKKTKGNKKSKKSNQPKKKKEWYELKKEWHSCEICGFSFKEPSKLVRHMRHVHTKERPFKCETCGKAFCTNHDLNRHQSTVHSTSRPFICITCGKGFADKGNLVRHEKTCVIKKKSEQQFPCSECSLVFEKKSDLVSHWKLHPEFRPFHCEVCGKGFTKNSDLSRHLRIHTGEKPFPCSICGKGFGRKSDVATHELIHNGEKNLPCYVCGMLFLRKVDLMRHQRSHTGEKPYACNFCDKKFARSGSRKKHERSHYKELNQFAYTNDMPTMVPTMMVGELPYQNI